MHANSFHFFHYPFGLNSDKPASVVICYGRKKKQSKSKSIIIEREISIYIYIERESDLSDEGSSGEDAESGGHVAEIGDGTQKSRRSELAH